MSIFISYRRDDSAGWTGRLAEDLRKEFGKENVFLDIDTIKPGFLFRESIRERLVSCKVALVVVGPQWLKATDADGHRRIDNPNDVVRSEIAEALKMEIPVIPVLVGNALMPSHKEVPEELGGLLLRQGYEFTDRYWNYQRDDFTKLLKRGEYLGKKDKAARGWSLGSKVHSTTEARTNATLSAPSRDNAAEDLPPRQSTRIIFATVMTIISLLVAMKAFGFF